jgi:dihydrofolate synthase / folylpolyglutamate synthase
VDAAGRAERYLESLALLGMRFGLERMHALLAELGHPERAFDAIHVVGSNGKSSTVRFAEALLLAEGVRTGAYLSPHLVDFRERIRVGGKTIAPEPYAAAVAAVESAAGHRVTQFEALTAAAFLAFARARVEWAVVEAGLGGRLDATNVLARSRVQVLTNVSLEHTDLLGDTREAIAGEKLAVVPTGGTLVLGEPGWERLAPQAGRVRTAAAAGSFQARNRAVALAAVEEALGRPVAAAALKGVRVPGRLEVRAGEPLEIWDGAHNPAGMEALAAELPALLGGRPAVAVVGVLRDKDLPGMLAALRRVAPAIVATQSGNPRALPAVELAALAGDACAGCDADPARALALARRLAGPRGAVVVCGSLYLLHDLGRRLGVYGMQESAHTVP